MIANYSSLDQSWTDLNSPTKSELDSLILSQNIDPLAAKDLLAPTPEQYLSEFGDTLYMVLHIPAFRRNQSENTHQEIDFILTKDSLITTRYESIDALHHFAKQVEVNETLNRGGEVHLFFGLMREVYKFLSDEAAYLEDWIKEIEKNIFEGQEKDMVWGISVVSRNLLGFRRLMNPHKEIFESLAQIGGEKFGLEFRREARELLDEWRRLSKKISEITEVLEELRDTNNSLLSTKQNEIMKIFTILAFVTFPLSLLASIFGMNTDYIPIVGSAHDFWIIVGMMFCLSLVMFAYFKYKRWI